MLTLTATLSSCTLALPGIGVWRAKNNTDVTLDDRGCLATASGSATCVHPAPVYMGTTIAVNGLVGVVIDATVIVIASRLWSLRNFGNGDLFPD